MAESMKIPSWAWLVIAIVGAYLIIGQIGKTAQGAIGAVGKAKSDAAQGYAAAGASLLTGIGSALGSFFHSSSSAPSPSSVASVPDDSLAVSQYDALSTSELDTLREQDVSAGMEGPF